MTAGYVEGIVPMADFGIARGNMIESQVRPSGVTDARIIGAMADVPREEFVPGERRALAYMDDDIPVGRDAQGRSRYLLEPMALARLLQLADIRPDSRVLDVACATGYSTAVIARLAAHVTAVEEDDRLAAAARETLERLSINNASVVQGPHAAGHKAGAPYDVIVINGRLGDIPRDLLAQSKDDGRLVLVLGKTETAPATVVVRNGTAVSHRRWFDLSVPEATGFPVSAPRFNF